MKKNGQWVGVDEKYIPEEEKYTDESIVGVTTNEMIDKEKTKKILKGVGIGYLIFVSLILIMVITVFVVVISRFVNFI